MTPTDGVIREAWGLYKAQWRHFLPISFVVYVGIAIIGALLTALLGWFGAIIAALISLVGVFWSRVRLPLRSKTFATAAPTSRSGRRSTECGPNSGRSS